MSTTTLDKLFSDFNKACKSEVFTMGNVIHTCERIPFTSPDANRILHGGIPRGRVIEFFGAEGSGKTTTALDVVANAQRVFHEEYESEVASLTELEENGSLKGKAKERLAYLKERGEKLVLWVDTENTFDDEWAETLGVDVSNMWMMSPGSNYAEQIFEVVIQAIDTDKLGLVVIDSLAMMLSKQEAEKTVEDKVYGGISMALSRFSREVESICARTNCALIGINQMRENLNAAGYGGPTYTTPGGKCWKHACSVRLMFKAGTPFDSNFVKINKSDPNPFGHKVEISVTKTKVCKPDRKVGSYTLTYSGGIQPLIDMIELAETEGILIKSGSWYSFVDTETGEVFTQTDENGKVDAIKVCGKPKLIVFLSEPENEKILLAVKKAVDDLIA